MSERYLIKPSMVLTIGKYNLFSVPYVVTNSDGVVIDIGAISKVSGATHEQTMFLTRQKCIKQIEYLHNLYNVDMIILEKNVLMIDKIDKYPDPLVLRQVLFGFGLLNSIEDKFFYDIKYIMEIPNSDWRKYVLPERCTYAIDLFKSHVYKSIYITTEQLESAETINCYETICMSESVTYKSLMNKKYQVNYAKSEVSSSEEKWSRESNK